MADIYAAVNASAARNGARSLPRVQLPADHRRSRSVSNPNLGMTIEGPERKGLPPFFDVVGQPSLTIQQNAQDGVTSMLRRNSQWTENITDDEFEVFKRILKKALERAISLSRGNLSYMVLRQKNHPYGIGPTAANGNRRRGLGRLTRLRGVSNRAVVNTHTGEFLRSWKDEAVRDKNGIALMLINESKVAPYLAFGSKIMKAHGPFVTALALYISEINQEWLKVTRRAYSREMALRGFG